jgi:hypothetical protein
MIRLRFCCNEMAFYCNRLHTRAYFNPPGWCHNLLASTSLQDEQKRSISGIKVFCSVQKKRKSSVWLYWEILRGHDDWDVCAEVFVIRLQNNLRGGPGRGYTKTKVFSKQIIPDFSHSLSHTHFFSLSQTHHTTVIWFLFVPITTFLFSFLLLSVFYHVFINVLFLFSNLNFLLFLSLFFKF